MNDDRDSQAEAHHQAMLEQEQIGEETLNRLAQAGGNVDDLKYIAWMAGLTRWKPDAQRRAA